MKRIVLCPGPSAANYRPFEGSPIAVNRAIKLAPWADAWVCLDRHTYAWGRPNGARRLAMPMEAYRQLARDGERSIREYEHVPVGPRLWASPVKTLRWWRHGWATAVALAVLDGATVIECVGMDWEGNEDFDLFTDRRQNRDAGRWDREAELFGQLAEALAAEGIALTRRNKS